MKYAFITLGCKVNQYETNAMEALVESKGHFVVPDGAGADVVVVNSCTVTAESDRKTRQTVRRAKKDNPGAILVLTGCMPQAFPDQSSALQEADVVMGNANLPMLCELVDRFAAGGERVVAVSAHEKAERYSTPPIEHFCERTRAYLKIEDGCERYCTYCIIPKARGFVRSKTVAEIQDEVAQLVQNGHKEIVLVGINLSAYGSDIGCNLCDAVDATASIDGVERIRLGSLEPDLFDDETLNRLAKQPKLCPQFHFSLQSGCDATLKRMNRHYDSAFYYDLITRVRAAFDNASITTDIMVGFAGESEEEFEQSLAFAEKAGFARSHIFAYSRREGTIAAGLDNQVSKAEKEQRSARMIALTRQSEQDFCRSQIGRIEEVLFEQSRDGWSFGYTKNYTPVKVHTADLHGQIIPVKLTDVFEDGCIGQLQ